MTYVYAKQLSCFVFIAVVLRVHPSYTTFGSFYWYMHTRGFVLIFPFSSETCIINKTRIKSHTVAHFNRTGLVECLVRVSIQIVSFSRIGPRRTLMEQEYHSNRPSLRLASLAQMESQLSRVHAGGHVLHEDPLNPSLEVDRHKGGWCQTGSAA